MLPVSETAGQRHAGRHSQNASPERPLNPLRRLAVEVDPEPQLGPHHRGGNPQTHQVSPSASELTTRKRYNSARRRWMVTTGAV